MKSLAACGFLIAVSLAARAQDPYADSVVSYVTGTGAGFQPAYDNSSVALGAPASAAVITAPAYGSSEILGVGENGELTIQFDTPITNDPTGHADGMDFTIFGNQFFVLGSGGVLSGIYDHTGLTVWVSQDDVNFFQLIAPDGQPHGADDLYPTEGSGNPFLPVNPSLSLSNFVGQSSANALSLYDGSAGGSSYSISWAQDASGAPADLPSISYIKIEGTSGYGYIDAISRVESVPEPAGAALILLGASGLFFMRRRLRKIPAGVIIAAALLHTTVVRAQDQTFTMSNIQYWAGTGTNQSALVISWNDGITPDSLAFGYRWDALPSGSAPTIYDMMESLQSADSFLSFTANPEYDSPGTGDWALYSAFYNLTGGAGPVVGAPYNLGGSENGYAPAGDHYKEGWYSGFWGEDLGIGDPYDGGSWENSTSEGLAVDTLSNDSWYGLSFSTDETNFTIPDPGYPSALFPVPVPEPASPWLLTICATGLLACLFRRRKSGASPP